MFWYFFCSVAIFCISFDTERNSKIDFPLTRVWSLSRSQRSPKISCIGNCIKKYYSVPQICILRNGFLSGERNSLLDFPFAWMSNSSNKHILSKGWLGQNYSCYCFCCVAIFCNFLDFLWTEQNSKMDFPLAQVWNFCGTFLLCFFFFFFCILWISFDTERNSKMDFPLAQVWSLSRS